MAHVNKGQLERMWEKSRAFFSFLGMFAGRRSGRYCTPSIANLQSLGNAPPLHATSTGAANEHSTAAAQDVGILEDYLLWVRSCKKATCNISQLLEVNHPRGQWKEREG